MRLGGLILAGGRSRRMGRPKESLPIGDMTMLEWQCRTLISCTEVVVTVGRDPSQPLPQIPAQRHTWHDDPPLSYITRWVACTRLCSVYCLQARSHGFVWLVDASLDLVTLGRAVP